MLSKYRWAQQGYERRGCSELAQHSQGDFTENLLRSNYLAPYPILNCPLPPSALGVLFCYSKLWSSLSHDW